MTTATALETSAGRIEAGVHDPVWSAKQESHDRLALALCSPDGEAAQPFLAGCFLCSQRENIFAAG